MNYPILLSAADPIDVTNSWVSNLCARTAWPGIILCTVALCTHWQTFSLGKTRVYSQVGETRFNRIQSSTSHPWTKQPPDFWSSWWEARLSSLFFSPTFCSLHHLDFCWRGLLWFHLINWWVSNDWFYICCHWPKRGLWINHWTCLVSLNLFSAH